MNVRISVEVVICSISDRVYNPPQSRALTLLRDRWDKPLIADGGTARALHRRTLRRRTRPSEFDQPVPQNSPRFRRRDSHRSPSFRSGRRQ